MGKNISAADTVLRQWHMLRALHRHPRRVTTADLRRVLEAAGYSVTPRTIQRDLLELSSVFPLDADERARPFGWCWQANAPVFNLPILSAQEALAFAMVEDYLEPLLPQALLAQLRPYFREARRRLTGDGPKSGAGSWLGKIAAVQPTQALVPPKIDAGVQRAATDALLYDRRLSVRYRRKGETAPRRYVLNPLGLIQRGPVSYLLATVGDYDDPLLFALHRIERASVLDGPLRCPPGFTLSAYLATTGAGHFGAGATIRLEADFDAPAAEHLRETALSPSQTLTERPDGRVRVEASVLDTPQLRWWLLAFGSAVEVLRPAGLRREIAAAATAMAARYAA